MDYIMETVGLRKSYKGNVVVNDVNIHVPKGAIYGFVGPNGAGKSTVMKMILNLIQPEAGEVQLFGEKVTDQSYEVFKRVGSIIENPYFYEKMTARQNLELHCDYMGFPNKERIDEVLQMVAQVRQIFAGYDDFSNINSANIFSAIGMSNQNPYGGTYEIFANPSNPRQFVISVNGLTQSDCESLVTKVWSGSVGYEMSGRTQSGASGECDNENGENTVQITYGE